ncbi:MAG: serine--tRNA ligase [Gemmatimonadales bacterium]|nr:serine--tRNA ligase [Gemmatimonadales bacterium]MBA3555003.1 serine--tRNA ligase [Gemmatimonadales bacterium]
MIDLKRLRQDPDGSRASLLRRRDPALAVGLDEVLELDRRRRDLLGRAEALKAERNAASEEVARLKRAGEPAADLMAQLKESGDAVKGLDAELREVDGTLDARAMSLPNFALDGVPDGDATANRVLRNWGELPRFDFVARPHWELGTELGILDLPAGARIAGSGFPLFKRQGARLIRALAGFMLDLHTREHGYEEVAPPYLVNRATLTGTGQLPKFEEDLYAVPADDLFLLPTAEVPVTNIHRDEILDGAALPRGYVACTPCFRREAGAHGKDTRGLIRVHQFDKVELVRFARPEDSPAEHELITRHAETVLQRLEIPYRVVDLAAGDLGFSSARTYDLEVWAAGVGAWLEVSSSSSFTDFQARRANIRYRPGPKAKPELLHTLNASGVAFPRTIIALLENNQAADGSVRVPAALVPYLGVERLVPGA